MLVQEWPLNKSSLVGCKLTILDRGFWLEQLRVLGSRQVFYGQLQTF